MLTDRAGMGEWGFSALVVADGHRLLFDTGARPETVLHNARELKIDLSGVTEVILSHHHGDHTGGLVTLRAAARQNPKALEKAYVGEGIFLSRPGTEGRETNESVSIKSEYEKLGGSFAVIDRPTELFPGAWLTGPVPRKYPERNWSLRRMVKLADGRLVEDTVPEDMSLVFDTDKGLVMVAGCGHAGIVNTLEYGDGRSGRRPYMQPWADSICLQPTRPRWTGRPRSFARLASVRFLVALYGDRGGLRPARAARSDSRDLPGRCRWCQIQPRGRARSGSDRSMTSPFVQARSTHQHSQEWRLLALLGAFSGGLLTDPESNEQVMAIASCEGDSSRSGPGNGPRLVTSAIRSMTPVPAIVGTVLCFACLDCLRPGVRDKRNKRDKRGKLA